MTRALVVDDSQFMRTVIGNALADAGYEVETATNGRDALEAVDSFEPDVVTMDVEMPEMDGIEAVERIMAADPVPILMLSAYTEEGARATFEALDSGAIDFLRKPDGSGSRNVGHLATEVVEKVTELANADVSSLAVAKTTATARATATATASRSSSADRAAAGAGGAPLAADRDATQASDPASMSGDGDVSTPSWALGPTDDSSVAESGPVDVTGQLAGTPTVVVGASTGGPRIVEQLFERLPAALEARVLVVQHMPAAFTSRFADRLDTVGEYTVSEAADGGRIGPGEAVVAPGDAHLTVTGETSQSIGLALENGERVHGARPSIDVTMESVANRVSEPLCGVVLSGMGRDGAAGVEALEAAGGYTIAQDEATSPVFGIPCQAIKTGCVEEIAPPAEIVDGIVAACTVDDQERADSDSDSDSRGETDD
ncbi:chemotaxis-specific protein-glutamate methyltransferase CheB [Halobiforma nitratireducens]|uniref:Protein-glutamate methylesterase/protein-glutamine glutaminase n=1 Tax=Halobiforma nitratireducens JCM 10879 TaxID=1227454 RepID=M0MD46_9EURY|nr:chemotaxis-specific protein-glutamate methyltransferase CheB [Halobiforma nitratireducens]EMA42564.1 chemotaxis-specific methylesterase [Halobiforma nitratireducens JCM 10879]